MLLHLKEFCQSKLRNASAFCIPPIAVHEVAKFIITLKSKNKKTMGPDNITPYLLKIALPYVVESLTYVYNLCIEQNIFQTALKNAKVVPLPKTNVLSDPSNYRPISLLHVISKPLERHIHKHLLQYLENNKLIHQYQSGFRPDHSCHTALMRLCDGWLSAINGSEIVGTVFLDFKKLLILWITLFHLRSSHFMSKTLHHSLFFSFFFILILRAVHNMFSLITSHVQRD